MLESMIHNIRLIKRAEAIISEYVKSEGCYLYLKNPDGSRIRIQPGAKLEDYEIHGYIIQKEDD